MRTLQVLLALAYMADVVMPANILVMMPLPLYSHTNNFMPIFKGLAARGHNVTMVSPYPQKKPIPNLNDVVVPDLTHQMFASFFNSTGGDKPNILKMDGILFDLFAMWFIGASVPKVALDCEVVQRFIKDKDSKFDLVITETWFLQESFVAFGHKFNAPVINVASTFIQPLASYVTGNILPASYVPVPRLPYSDHMSYVQRLWNTFYYFWDILVGNTIYIKNQDAVVREYFVYPGSENLPPLIDMLRNTSLTLMDSTFAVNYPAPLHKNVIEIGGINIKTADKLPDDLQKLMDTAKEGVVYLSFGSHINVSSLDTEMQADILSALGKLKQKVLMKIEEGNPTAKLAKPNTLIKSWFPQSSILAHPNCKLFITHAGLHGTMEGLYNALPMVAIPLLGDQKYNAKFLEAAGVAQVLKPLDITEENLLSTINSVLNNPSYRENALERSAIFKDTPMNTLDNVIYWIEYVIRHKGAPHLKPAAVDLYWFQLFSLDVIAFYILILVLIVFILKCIIVSIFSLIKRLFIGKSASKKQKKKKE